MKLKSVICLLLAFGLSTAPAFGADICTTVGRAVTMSAEQIDNFNEDHIRGNNFQGRGKILRFDHNDVDLDLAYTIVVDCGNKVLVTLYADEMFGKSHHIEKGAMISFYGKCSEIRRHYPDGIR